jgi:TctA family transporter
VGLNNPAAFPRLTFGSTEMLGGLGMIPLMIGMFAISRSSASRSTPIRR